MASILDPISQGLGLQNLPPLLESPWVLRKSISSQWKPYLSAPGLYLERKGPLQAAQRKRFSLLVLSLETIIELGTTGNIWVIAYSLQGVWNMF